MAIAINSTASLSYTNTSKAISYTGATAGRTVTAYLEIGGHIFKSGSHTASGSTGTITVTFTQSQLYAEMYNENSRSARVGVVEIDYPGTSWSSSSTVTLGTISGISFSTTVNPYDLDSPTNFIATWTSPNTTYYRGQFQVSVNGDICSTSAYYTSGVNYMPSSTTLSNMLTAMDGVSPRSLTFGVRTYFRYSNGTYSLVSSSYVTTTRSTGVIKSFYSESTVSTFNDMAIGTNPYVALTTNSGSNTVYHKILFKAGATYSTTVKTVSWGSTTSGTISFSEAEWQAILNLFSSGDLYENIRLDLETYQYSNYTGKIGSTTYSSNRTVSTSASTISNYNAFNIESTNTAGFTLNRAYSGFTNVVEYFVGAGTTDLIKTFNAASGTGNLAVTTTFSDSEKQNIYEDFSSGETSITIRVRVTTKYGTTVIGTAVTSDATASITPSTISILSPSSIDLSETVSKDLAQITINRASSLFTHDVKITVLSTPIKTFEDAIPTGTETTYTPNLLDSEQQNIFTAVTSSTYAIIKYQVETFYGTVQIGATQESTGIGTFPDSIAPELASGNISIIEGNSSNETGLFIQNVSTFSMSIADANITKKYSATISSVKFELPSVFSLTETTPTGGNYTTTSPTITLSGSQTVKVTITDSRGKIVSVNAAAKTLVPYSIPKYNALSAKRVDSGGADDPIGTYLKITYNIEASSLINGTEQNALSLKIETQPRPNLGYTTEFEAGITGISESSTKTYSGYSVDDAYDVKVTITDNFNSNEEILLLPTGNVILSLTEDAVGIFNLNPSYPLDVTGDINVTGGYKIDGTALAASDVGALSTADTSLLSGDGTIISITNAPAIIGESAAVISHATTAGNKHVPTGGATGQFLKYGGSSGTASWATPTQSDVGAIGMRAWLSSTQTLTGDAANYILFDETSTNGFQDTGISYSTSTGVFTLTDGVWWINTHISLGSTTVGKYYIARLVSGSSNTELVRLAGTVAYSTGNISINGSTLRLVNSTLGYTYRIAAVPQTNNATAVEGSARTYLEIFKVR